MQSTLGVHYNMSGGETTEVNLNGSSFGRYQQDIGERDV
jgi:hypothetical protein